MRFLRNLTAVAGTLAAILALATPAFAGKSTLSGSIELASATALGLASIGPTYGGEVSFEISVDGKLSSQSRVYVAVVCEQKDRIVYQWSADPDFDFPLVDQAGQGLEWDGGDAACTATLIYRVERGRNVEIRFLDQTSFEASGTSV